MTETITPDELQHLLRQFQHLENCEVERVAPMLSPNNVNVKGVIQAYGEYLFWEVPVDLTTIKNADDVLRLVENLHKSFDRAAAQSSSGLN